jgi:protein-L-isoaspartate O-methyltransferase
MRCLRCRNQIGRISPLIRFFRVRFDSVQLLAQLKPGGRMIIPVGTQGYNQMLEQIDKLPNGEIKREKLIGVVYVPLTDRQLQCPNK